MYKEDKNIDELIDKALSVSGLETYADGAFIVPRLTPKGKKALRDIIRKAFLDGAQEGKERMVRIQQTSVLNRSIALSSIERPNFPLPEKQEK